MAGRGETFKTYVVQRTFRTVRKGYDPEEVDRTRDLLLDRHLAWEPAGTWMDCFDAEGRPVADHIPASILYHVLLAFAELLRLEDRIKGGRDVGRERTGV